MFSTNTEHTSTNTSDAITWVSALVQDTTPQVAPIRTAVIEASRIIANEMRVADQYKALGRQLRLGDTEDPTSAEISDELNCQVAMEHAVALAGDVLRGEINQGDSISGLINHEVGPGDKAGRKQALQNILALFQNVLAWESMYLVDHYDEIWSTYERLQSLMDDAEFYDTNDVEITFEDKDETSEGSREGDSDNDDPISVDALLALLEA